MKQSRRIHRLTVVNCLLNSGDSLWGCRLEVLSVREWSRDRKPYTRPSGWSMFEIQNSSLGGLVVKDAQMNRFELCALSST
jgi:hypothetical protein